MIKIDRNIKSQKITHAKSVLDEEKSKGNGTYNKPEVVAALKIIIHGHDK